MVATLKPDKGRLSMTGADVREILGGRSWPETIKTLRESGHKGISRAQITRWMELGCDDPDVCADLLRLK